MEVYWKKDDIGSKEEEKLKPILGGMEAWKQPCWSW